MALLAWWKGPVLVLLVGLMVFTYIHDGPPYFDVADLIDNQLHHEKILVLLGIGVMFVLLWPPRDRIERVMFGILVAVLLLIVALVLQ